MRPNHHLFNQVLFSQKPLKSIQRYECSQIYDLKVSPCWMWRRKRRKCSEREWMDGAESNSGTCYHCSCVGISTPFKHIWLIIWNVLINSASLASFQVPVNGVQAVECALISCTTANWSQCLRTTFNYISSIESVGKFNSLDSKYHSMNLGMKSKVTLRHCFAS